MCISNGIDAGLMSNAVWTGVSDAQRCIEAAAPQRRCGEGALARRRQLHRHDSLAKALDPSTLVVYEMNGVPLPQRHGFPCARDCSRLLRREKREMDHAYRGRRREREGILREAGLGTEFHRADAFAHRSAVSTTSGLDAASAAKGIRVKGVAFGGDRGISRVEVSTDDGNSWGDASMDYPGTRC